GDRLASRVDPLGPVHADETFRYEVLSVRSIQHKEVSVAGSLRKHFARPPIEYAIEQHRRFHVVPVVRIVRRGLKVPDQFSGIGVERDNRASPEVGSLARLAGIHWIWIAGAPVQ